MSKHDFDTIKNLKVDAPDYKSWKNEGVELVIFRATCGDGTDQYKKNGFPDIDPSFSKEIQKASAAGLHVGAYHLLRSGQDSKEQARFFHKTVTRALRNDNNARNSGLILALDIGVPASTEAAHPHGSTPDEIALFILEMNNLLRMDGSNSSAGVLGIYPENKYTAKIPNGNGGKKEIKSDFLRNLRNAKEPARTTIQDCWLWGSDYRQREPDFTNSYGLWGKVATLHQYSGGRDLLVKKPEKWTPKDGSPSEWIERNQKWDNRKWPTWISGYYLPVESNRLSGRFENVDGFMRACAFTIH